MIIAWNDEETGSRLQATALHNSIITIKISIILNPISNASINKVTSINSISQSLTHKLNTIKIITLSKLLGDALINRVSHLYSFFQVTLRGCSYERNYTTWAVSRANYFWKWVGAQNWKCPNRDMEKVSELRNNWQRLNMLKATEVIIYTRTKLEGKQIIAAEKMR